MKPSPEDTRTLLNACAIDSSLYSREFFPNTVRLKSPDFHAEMWEELNTPDQRYLAFEVFRDGAKTSLVRLFLSHRVAYGLSNTIMIVSASLAHSEKTLQWLRQQVETNDKWSGFYQLAPGYKWTDSWLVIQRKLVSADGKITTSNISVIAVGITGQTRGVNVDDHRPDLIVVDDPDDEESSGTMEQRKKAKDRFFGAVKNSLSPATENPEAKMVLLQTPLAEDDILSACKKAPDWKVLTFGVFDENGESRWPSRYPTEQLLKDKESAIALNQLYLWLREKECVLSSPETNDFKPDWLKYWEIPPERMAIIMALDPAPPPSEKQIAEGFARKDYEVFTVVGWFNEAYYLLDVSRSRGHEPDWTISEFFRLWDKWKPYKMVISAVNYEKTLKWLFEQGMKKQKRYLPITLIDDKRSKRHRILQSFAGITSSGCFYSHPNFIDFNQQFELYPNVQHDDDLDSASLACEDFITYPPDDFLEVYEGEDAHYADEFLSAP